MKREQVLTLREYESARIGSGWDPARRVIPMHLAAALETYQCGLPTSVLDMGRNTITARQYIGSIGIGEHVIEILPKTDTADTAAVRANLMTMLATAGLVPAVDGGLAAQQASSITLVDAYMRSYLGALWKEWHRGPAMHYRDERAQRPCLRGKLLFGEHIRLNRTHPERFFTRAEERMTDVPISRLLKAAVQVCRQFAPTVETRRQALELLQDFTEVTDQEFNPASLEAPVINRQFDRFRPLVELARLLLGGRVPDRSGQAPTYSLLFDMNMVFERYIGRLLQQSAGSNRQVRLQLKDRALLSLEGKDRFRLSPDIGVYEHGRLVCIIDTKWKHLNTSRNNAGVTQADMYQMYAYGKQYDCPLVMLLYPGIQGQAAEPILYQHQHSEVQRYIVVCTINLDQAADGGLNKRVSDELQRLLAKCLASTEHHCTA